MYGELGKLAGSGLAEVVSEGARRRKEYALTDAGMTELRHWLIDVEPSAPRRSDLLLRVFFLDVLELGRAEEFMRRRSARATAYHDELLAISVRLAGEAGPLIENGRLMVEWGG